ncbi:MAG: S8 family serine peptidase [Polyangiales bacterium]
MQRVTRLPLACGFWACLGVYGLFCSGSARAQLQSDPNEHGDAPTLAYRDGAATVSVRRLGVGQVALETGPYRYEAGVGRGAIVQPSAAGWLTVPPTAAGTTEPGWANRLGLHVLARLSRSADLYWVESTAQEDGVDLAVRLRDEPLLAIAVPDLALPRTKHATLSEPPDDPRYSGQWYLKRMKIEPAWQLQSGDPDVIVVVIDDGCDLKHPDLADAWPSEQGYDAIDDDDEPSYMPNLRGNAHGTQCAGLVGARANNQIGIAGVCPDCSLRCVRLLRADDQGVPLSSDIRAFDYAFEVGAAVVSNSWGFSRPMPVSAPLAEVLRKLYEEGRDGRGTVLAFSAGNENRMLRFDELTGLTSVLTVGATNNFDEAAPFGNFGPALALSAPTGSVTTDISGADGDTEDDYTSLFGGTSSSCPIVAGVAGLMISAKPELTAAEAYATLRETARKAPYASPDAEGHDVMYGYGIIDPAAALRSVLGLPAPEPAAGSGGAGAAGRPSQPRDAGPPDEEHEAEPPANADAAVRGDAGSQDAARPEPQSPDKPASSSDDGGCHAAAFGGGFAAWPSFALWVAMVVGLRRRRHG